MILADDQWGVPVDARKPLDDLSARLRLRDDD